tara:strand:- start:1209 stop:1823 length:615 start_codon:yes stop_codon:yes gene_type:complete
MRLITVILIVVITLLPSTTVGNGIKKVDVFSVQNNEDFVLKIFSCVKTLYTEFPEKYPLEKQIPFDLIVAMAAYESAWGKSRFAFEGNNLFGIRTWDPLIPQMKAKQKPNAPWGVRKYETYCTCIVDYIQILNNHPAYEEFRTERSIELETYGYTNATNLAQFLVAWSELGDQYTNRLREIIVLIHKQGYYQGLPVDNKGRIIK